MVPSGAMIAKALEVLAVQVFYAMTFALAAQEKWAGPLPEWFTGQFGATWMARAPGGLTAAYFGIALAETLAAFAFIASIVRLEPLRADRPVLRAALILAVFLFAGLAYGQRLTAKYDSAAFLFGYFAGTLLILRAVEARA
jgi:hypothetical protein